MVAPSPPFDPSPEQRAVLAHPFGQHGVIVAGPGTGKSSTVIDLVQRLSGAANPAPRIRLLTFTRAATAELAATVERHPVVAVERPSTIHSFALSILVRNGGVGSYPKPLRLIDDWERDAVILPCLQRHAGISKQTLKVLLRELEAAWESLTPSDDPGIDAATRAHFRGILDAHRRLYGYTLLQQIPFLLKEVLDAHGAAALVGVDIDVLAVDEYQDLNRCDISVLVSIASNGTAVVGAGDPDQSIYSFRKAAPQAILDYPTYFPGAAGYALTETRRFGSAIVPWAQHVIDGDPSRPTSAPRLRAAPGNPPGEVALLSFASDRAEARGVAAVVAKLIAVEGIDPGSILVLMRTDHNHGFSAPIKAALAAAGIHATDPEAVKRILAVDGNRFALECMRLLVRADDPVSWASLVALTPGIGDTFIRYVDGVAGADETFGNAMLRLRDEGFPEAPRSASRAAALIDSVRSWLASAAAPGAIPVEGWGHWVAAQCATGIVPALTPDMIELLHDLDAVGDPEEELGRFVGQIEPLAKDMATARDVGVRLMTMSSSKGLTVDACIVVGCEEGVVPHPMGPIDEEHRLLYVAMTRARRFLFCTWAQRRTGPTARVGTPVVGGLRGLTTFLRGGPVRSQDGTAFIRNRW